MKRLLIISNRLPVQFAQKDGVFQLQQSAGGLVSSMKSYLQKQEKIPGAPLPLWIGTLDITEKKYNKLKLSEQLVNEEFGLCPVFLPATMQDKFYNGFCNDTIWPLFHYFPSYARFRDDYYEQYVQANQRFCEKIVAVYEPGDTIWVHDYHLMLLPAMLRRALPDATIGFFLHIPFPSFEVFRMLPNAWRKEILEGLLGADLVGFHTNSYAQYFLSSVKQLLGYEVPLRSVITPERSVAVDVFPVGIDFEKFHGVMNVPEIFAERNRIRKRLGEARLVISVDRLDYTKGIVNRLEGFELFLSEHPDYCSRVSFLMIIVPSRDIISKYRELKETIEGLVGRINGKFGALDWTPVIYQYRSVDFNELAGMYAAADVALITPVRDGMNLVAKEFVASRADKRGVLVLGETAGAAAELGEALLINPTDRREVSNALLQALVMPVQEQMNRNDFMQRRLRNYDVVRWATEFLDQLGVAHAHQEDMKVKLLAPSMENVMLTHYRHAKKRLLLLDYDGTLAPIVRYPHLAFPGEELLHLLKTLSEDERNTLVVISGRPREVLDEWLGGLQISLVAEHGAFQKRAGEEWQEALTAFSAWKENVQQLMSICTARCPGSFIEEKRFSLAWHYRNADPELGFLRSRELHNDLNELATHLGFQVTEGKKVIEARPRGIDKGTAAMQWLAEGPFDFSLAAGDDRTDEDLFRAMPPDTYSIRIGLVQSLARFNVAHQKDVLQLLERLQAEPSALTPRTDVRMEK